MGTTFLIVILSFTLLMGFTAFVFLLFNKKDNARFQKMVSIATVVTSLTTVVVGLSTISFALREEQREKKQQQPLFTARLESNYSSEKSLYDNEEYVVYNEGTKTLNKTDVTCYTFLEVGYVDIQSHNPSVTIILPLKDYFGVSINTGYLDGIIEYSRSNNNREQYFDFYMRTLNYHGEHEGIYVSVEKKHFFVINYVDILGESQEIVKTFEIEVDPKQFEKYRKTAERDSKGNDLYLSKLNIDDIIDTYFAH